MTIFTRVSTNLLPINKLCTHFSPLWSRLNVTQKYQSVNEIMSTAEGVCGRSTFIWQRHTNPFIVKGGNKTTTKTMLVNVPVCVQVILYQIAEILTPVICSFIPPMAVNSDLVGDNQLST